MWDTITATCIFCLIFISPFNWSRSNTLGCFTQILVVSLWCKKQFTSPVCGPCVCHHCYVILTSCGGCLLSWRSCWMSLSFSAWLERSFCSWTSKAATRVSLSFLHFSMICSFSASWDDKDSWQRGTCKICGGETLVLYCMYVCGREWERDTEKETYTFIYLYCYTSEVVMIIKTSKNKPVE